MTNLTDKLIVSDQIEIMKKRIDVVLGFQIEFVIAKA